MPRAVLLNGQTVKKELLLKPCTVREACIQICGEQEFSVPVVAVLNGQPVLRKDGGWERAKAAENALLLFMELPKGGGDGGSNPLQIIAQVVLVAVVTLLTFYYTGPVGGMTAAGFTATWGTNAAVAICAATVMMLGSLAINAAFAQRAKGFDGPEAAEAASPTYSINANGNTARLNQAEGEGFGLMRITPDYISQPYAEYASNDQFAHFIYGVGRGTYSIKKLYFGDTLFWDVSQGGFIDSGLVSEDGEEFSQSYSVNLAIGGDWSGPYPAVASGEQAKTLRVTVNFPDGYGILRDEPESFEAHTGGDNDFTYTETVHHWTWESKTATILIQYAEIDGAGNVIGNWSNTITKTANHNANTSYGRDNWYMWNASQPPSGEFSTTVSIRTPRFARWAIRVKNGSAAIPHPQIDDPQSLDPSATIDDPNAWVYEAMKLTGVASTAVGVRVQLVESGDKVTLFPDNITTSSEVSSIDLLAPNDEEYVAPGWKTYAANDPGTLTTKIKLDYAYQTGLGKYKENGGMESYGVSLEAQACAIDDLGAETGSWFGLGQWTDTACTATAQRKTRSFSVPSGRYKVRMRRTSNTHASDTAPSLDRPCWIGLRTVLPGSLTYPVYAIALRIKANNALSQQASQQFRVLAQRKLPVWNPQNRTWSEPQETRSWAAAVSAVCQEPWGGRMADRQIDLDTLWAIGATLDAKGWNCDCYIDGMYSMWQLLTELCQMVLVVPRMQGAVLSFVRDEPGRPVTYELNARNVIRGSFSVVYNTWTSNTPDDVILNYLDADAGYQQRDVQATLPQSESIEPTTLDWIGITDRTHAFRVAARYAAMNRWRRITVTCQVEALGRLLNVGDVVSVNHPRFHNTASGVVSGWNEASLKLVLESDFSGDASSASYISLVRPDGSAWGPVQVASIADGICILNSSDYSAYLLQGNDNPFSWLKDGTSSQPTHYALHATRNFTRRMLVQSVSADELWKYSVTLVNDAPEVAQYDELPVPAWNGRQQVASTLHPPKDLRIKATAATGILMAAWRAVQGAVQYEVQHSADGVTWIHDGFTTGTSMPLMNAESQNWSGNAQAGTVFVRVAAISNSQRSQWAEWPEED